MEVNELLIWARGPAFNMALAIFVFGMLLRLFEIISLGRKSDLSAARDSGLSGGLRTIFSRSLPRKTVFAREPLRILNGYILHIGLFVVIFFYRPHIELLGLDLKNKTNKEKNRQMERKRTRKKERQ